ncbi:FecCD family ABC transporter permease [Domibacillus robiginosus]|uniref:FecCD family ABC transporter permease n=1 Tax=Domibacillus robiginosus TaxID=1071054 RepID=UPI00067E3BD3|nr:iron ABC transporter permease [Domibacillus robiginosus]
MVFHRFRRSGIDNREGAVQKSRPFAASIILAAGLFLLVVLTGVSIAYGAADIQVSTVWNSFVHFDPAIASHQIIHELRMPRAVAAAAAGAFLAVSGAIMQGMTRNPLASPSIMGITAGSSFVLALAFIFDAHASPNKLVFWSFVGSGLGAFLVFGIGALSKRGLTPVKLALAGSAVTALLTSVSSALAMHFDVARDLSFWYAGGVAGIRWESVRVVLPIAVVGLAAAMLISRSITVLSLGEEVAKGLGQKVKLAKVSGLLVVLLLTGAAVSLAGVVGFVGLVIPHITRFLVGVDYRWIIPCSAVLGGLLLIMADIMARMINPPFETPLGAVTALVGVPFFLYLSRREGGGTR